MKTKDYQVFISFKNTDASEKATPDSAVARKVYEALRAAGVRVFFSEESLAERARAKFQKSIAEALKSAEILVLVGSCREYIESSWVEKEWETFLGEMLSGDKKHGELFVINAGTLKRTDLPLFLRQYQMFNADDGGLEKLVRFVRNKMPRPVTLDNLVCVSLHSLNPEKNEDRIYLITAHSPNGAGINVTAHWGGRKTKRLNSQLKASSLHSEAAVRSEVEKLKREKVRSGYRPVPYAKLLTWEARVCLEATLGLAVEPQVSANQGVAFIKKNRPQSPTKKPSTKRLQKQSATGQSKPLRKRRVKK